MNAHAPVPKSKVARYAAIGAIVSLLFAAIGHRFDAAVPAIPLNDQVLFNWLTLILAPVSFLLRFNDPDAAIVPGLSFALGAAVLNACWYAFLCWSLQAMRHALRAPASVPAPANVPAQPTVTESRSTRRTSPSERLADRYEHRLSSEQAASEVEAPVLSGAKH